MPTSQKDCTERADKHSIMACPGCKSRVMRLLQDEPIDDSDHSDYGPFVTDTIVSLHVRPNGLDSLRKQAMSVVALCDDIEQHQERKVEPKKGIADGVASRNRPTEYGHNSDVE